MGARGELATQDSIFKQLGEGGLGGMLFVFAAVTAASFAPVLRGKSSDEAFLKNSKPEEFGPFNAQAEMLNGRAAMMGLLFLLPPRLPRARRSSEERRAGGRRERAPGRAAARAQQALKSNLFLSFLVPHFRK